MLFRNTLPELFRGERGPWNPIREMSRLQRRLDHIFDEFMTEPNILRVGREFTPMGRIEFEPACDVEETKSHFVFNFDLPGVKKDEVKIHIQDNQLTISGERKQETQSAISRERYHGAFYRTFTLPANVDAEKIEAHYENGVLQIAIPKTAITTGKQIPIKEGKLLEGKGGKAA